MTTKTGWPQGEGLRSARVEGCKTAVSGLKSSRRNEGLGIGTEKTMKIHYALDAWGGRVVKIVTVTSWDRFQAQSIWGIPV